MGAFVLLVTQMVLVEGDSVVSRETAIAAAEQAIGKTLDISFDDDVSSETDKERDLTRIVCDRVIKVVA